MLIRSWSWLITWPDLTRPGFEMMRMIADAVVDLPQPDSPTRAKASPLWTWKLTSLTA